jgi:hypothetical protein
MSQPTTPLPIRLVRPAIIELRFKNPSFYNKQIGLYCRALRLNPPAPATAAPDSATFPVGLAPQGGVVKDMALRFILLKNNRHGEKRTITYWEAPAAGTPEAAYDSIQAVSNVLQSQGFTVVEKLPKKERTNTLKGKAIQTLLDDGSGNLVGLVINPPFPFVKSDTTTKTVKSINTPISSSTPTDNSHFSSASLLACLACLVVGLLVGRVTRKSA